MSDTSHKTTKELDGRFIASTYGRFDVDLVSGKGSVIYDSDGREYIDMCTGVAVNTLGLCDPEWTAAVEAQLHKLPHISNYFRNEHSAKLAALLCERTGMKRVFYSNSGAEANETAMKVARKYSYDKYGEGRSTIVVLNNGFHGRTFGALSATSQPAYHVGFGPLVPDIITIEPDNCEQAKKALSRRDVCAVLVELIQGEGGIHCLTKEFIDTVIGLCKEHDVLFICDEVQTGLGRTGTFFRYMAYEGLNPDIVCSAKALGGGIPIGATIIGEKAEHALTSGSHGSTFGGNPLACAGGVSILSRITDELMHSVKEKEALIRKTLEGGKGVIDIEGSGFMLGIRVTGSSKEITEECVRRGVLVITSKYKVRLLPALNIPTELLLKALNVIKQVIAEKDPVKT